MGQFNDKQIRLSLEQVESIMYDLGCDGEEAYEFWQLALRENRLPGILDEERGAIFAASMRRWEGN